MEPRICRTFRRSFVLTVISCGIMCYTWYVLTSYALITNADGSRLILADENTANSFRVPQSTKSRRQHTPRAVKPNAWKPGDYAVRAWLPRSIKERVEASYEDHRASAAKAGRTFANSTSATPVRNASVASAPGRTTRVSGSSREVRGGYTVKRLPQALIIGVKKCGTRALLEFLRLHPDIRATGPETHFFDRFYHRGLDWYRQQMPPSLPGQITMEKTPSYFITREVPQRIYSMSPAVKLVVVVRDPVTRAISDYTQTASKRKGTPSFEEMAFQNASTGLVDTSWSAIRIGVYARYLEWWLHYFSLQQVHFVSGETLVSDPAGEMARVQDFLGLKRVISDKHFYFNETKGFPCLKKSEGNGNPHCLGKTKGRIHPDIPASTIQRLRDFYRPFNTRFHRMVGRDFGWL